MKVSVFDHVDVRKYFVEYDGSGYLRDSANIDYATNNKLDQYRDLEKFFEECAKETLLKPFLTKTAMKKCFPFQDIDIRLQIDQLNFEKNSTFEEYRGDPVNAHFDARFSTISIMRRELKIVLDGKNSLQNIL